MLNKGASLRHTRQFSDPRAAWRRIKKRALKYKPTRVTTHRTKNEKGSYTGIDALQSALNFVEPGESLLRRRVRGRGQGELFAILLPPLRADAGCLLDDFILLHSDRRIRSLALPIRTPRAASLNMQEEIFRTHICTRINLQSVYGGFVPRLLGLWVHYYFIV